MLNRGSLLSLFLVGANLCVGERIYQLWKDRRWELDTVQTRVPTRPHRNKEELKRKTHEPLQSASTQLIIERNLFDPERGARHSKENDREAEALAQTMRRMRSMVLMGTVIIGDSRQAIVEDPGESILTAPRTQTDRKWQIRRLRLGDTIAGFHLTEIRDREIVFSKGPVTVDIAIDYFRKARGSGVPATRPGAPKVVSVIGVKERGPSVVPRVPRRQLTSQR